MKLYCYFFIAIFLLKSPGKILGINYPRKDLVEIELIPKVVFQKPGNSFFYSYFVKSLEKNKQPLVS